MVNLRLKKMEVQELRLWGHYYKKSQAEIGLGWDEDQKELIIKLNLAVGKDEDGEPLNQKEAKKK